MRNPPGVDADASLRWMVDDCDEKVRSRQRKFSHWKAANFWVGGLAAVLAATAGIGILSEWMSRDAAGALAVVAALTSALVGFYDFDGRTVRVGVERASWLRQYGLVSRLVRLRQAEGGRPMSPELRLEVEALWEQHCDLMDADARARSTD